MHKTLVLVLLIVLLLEPAVTTTPELAAALSLAPMELAAPAPHGILICDPCGMARDCCWCALLENHITTDWTFPDDWRFPDDWPEPQPELPTAPQPELQPEPTTNAERSPLYRSILERLEENATTVSRSTMETHIRGTYTLGDRIAQQGERRRQRQASRAGGFPCSFEGCDKSFNRQCETNRHEKTHFHPSERPHKCNECEKAFWYPKDLDRHQKTKAHGDHGSAAKHYCDHPDCSNRKPFSRRDNLRRHQRKEHREMAVSA